MDKAQGAAAAVVIVISGIALGFYGGVSSVQPSYLTRTQTATVPGTATRTILFFTTFSSTTYETTSCDPFVGCVPIDVPIVLNAFVVQGSVRANCGVVVKGYPEGAVCDVSISPGTGGTIVVNMTSFNGDSGVAFGTFSSSSGFVQFAQTYPCMYSAGESYLNAGQCPVSMAGSVYRFNYTVSQQLPAASEAVLTIVVAKTCCWP